MVGTRCQNPPRANAQVLDSIQALRQNDSPFRPYFAQVGLGSVGDKAANAFFDFVLVDMFASFCTGREDAKGAMKIAERQLQRIYR